ncbi:MAG: hypothetical protein ACOYMV_13060 [Verrucomicrobiia bacterium]
MALARIDELDAGQEGGLALRVHLSHCRSCATAAERVNAALNSYRADTMRTDTSALDLIEDRVMAVVQLLPPTRQDFALRDWFLPGAIIVASMLLLPLLGKDIGFLESLFGLALTAYSALFIATHLPELQSYLEKRGLLPR